MEFSQKLHFLFLKWFQYHLKSYYLLFLSSYSKLLYLNFFIMYCYCNVIMYCSIYGDHSKEIYFYYITAYICSYVLFLYNFARRTVRLIDKVEPRQRLLKACTSSTQTIHHLSHKPDMFMMLSLYCLLKRPSGCRMDFFFLEQFRIKS